MFRNIIGGLFFLLTLFFSTILVQGQYMNNEQNNTAFKDSRVVFNQRGNGSIDIQFIQGQGIPTDQFFSEYRKAFKLSADNEFKSFQKIKDNIGQTFRYKQYYKGLELAEVHFILHEKNGQVTHANGKIIQGLEVDSNPSLTEEEALEFALASINAKTYMWENKLNEIHLKKEQNDATASMYPKGKLMFSAKNFDVRPENFHLVYRFDIYAEKPMDRFYVDVDAKTGEIINKISRIQSGDVPGQGTSVYNGVVNLIIADTAISTNPPSRWHLDSWMAFEGGISWWISDPALGNQGGYDNGWYEGLDTDPVLLSGADLKLKFVHRFSVESPGGEPAGYNAWDGMNIRISTDNGNSWQVLKNPNPAYSNTSLYSFGE